MNKLKKFIYLAAIFIVNYTFLTTYCHAQWVQQNLPVNGQPFDMVFFDANTGIISLNTSPSPIPATLRTTNGGFNWSLSANIRIFRMDKIDSTTVYGNGRTNNGGDVIYKTTNKGITWDSVSISTNNGYGSISFVNRDTGWVVGVEGDSLTIWRTTNGGVTLVPQTRNIGRDRIFFLKQPIGGHYYGWVTFGAQIWRTTNSGINWNTVASAGTLTQLYFMNKDTGWTANGGEDILKTTNGGLSWITQTMPNSSQLVIRNIDRFKFINANTGWVSEETDFLVEQLCRE